MSHLGFGQLASEDVPLARYSSLNEVIDSTYALLSGPAGERDWEAFKLLFHPTASMGAVVPDQSGTKSKFHSFTPEKYISNNDPFLRSTDFYEDEIRRRVEAFDGIAHVLSSYQFGFAKDGPIQQYGVNMFQLVKEDGRWWITSLIWQPATTKDDLPPHLAH